MYSFSFDKHQRNIGFELKITVFRAPEQGSNVFLILILQKFTTENIWEVGGTQNRQKIPVFEQTISIVSYFLYVESIDKTNKTSNHITSSKL
jgi:hypothetical protein